MNANSSAAESNLNPQERKRILRILESNWQAEMRGRETYATLAERETDLNVVWLFALLPTQNTDTQIFGLGATAPWEVFRSPMKGPEPVMLTTSQIASVVSTWR